MAQARTGGIAFVLTDAVRRALRIALRRDALVVHLLEDVALRRLRRRDRRRAALPRRFVLRFARGLDEIVDLLLLLLEHPLQALVLLLLLCDQRGLPIAFCLGFRS